MKKLKEFWDEHKVEIILVGGVALVAGAMIAKHQFGKHFMNITGKRVISWRHDPKVGYMTLERVKEILDLNANNPNACFAMVKEPFTTNEYTAIWLNNSKIITSK